MLVPSVSAAGVTADTFYSLGGIDAISGKPVGTFQRFQSDDDGIMWSTVGQSMPVARYNLSAVTDQDNAIYAIGGQTDGGKVVGTVEQWNTRVNQWSNKNPMPRPRYSMAALRLDNSNDVFVVGGNLGGKPTNLVDIYHADTDSWSLAPANMSTPREGHCVGMISGVLYAVGGFDGSSFLSSMEAYSPSNHTWTPQPPMQFARSGASCAVVQNALVVAGGVNAGGVSALVQLCLPASA
jgi:N-acetylneuraminic acid mutarotase